MLVKIRLVVMSAMLLISFSTFMGGCGKKGGGTTPKAVSVEYRISAPAGLAQFTSIKYNSASGTTTDATIPSGSSFSQIISVTNKPFNAKLNTAVNNTTKVAITYELAIYVDGVSKNTISVTAPAQLQSTGEVSFTVQ